MPRQPHNKDQDKQESSSGEDDYQEPAGRGQSRSPSPTSSTSLTPLSSGPTLKEPLPRRAKRNSNPKAKKATTATITRAMVTRAKVIRQKSDAAYAKATGKRGEIVQSDDGGTESDMDIMPVKTSTPMTPRARTTEPGTRRGTKAQMKGDAESGVDIKPTVKTPTSKKPRAKPKGRAIGDPPDGDAVNDGDNRLEKTPTPKKPRGSKFEGCEGAGAGRAKTPTTPRKPRASRSKKITKMSPEDPFTTKTPLVFPIHGGNADDDKGSFPDDMPSNVSPPWSSSMDGVEMDKYVAATAMLALMTSNRDCDMMAMPQQERNGRADQYHHAYDTSFPRSPTVLPEAPELDTKDETDPDTAKATVGRTVFSPILNNQFDTPEPAFQKDRRQSRSTHLATKYMPSLPANATEFHMPVRIATRSSSAPAETRPISSQPPMTALRSSGLKLDLTTLQPWIDAAVRQPMSSMPSFLGETSKSYAAATTTAIATTTTPLAISPPESVYSLAKTIDAAYIKASSLLTHAMSLTSSSLVEQADAIRYHAVAQHVFEQELRMTESQWRTLFSHELVDGQTATNSQPPSPSSLFRADCASPLTVMLTPNIQNNAGKRPAESFQTPTRPPDQVSAKTRSSLYSSFSPFLAYSRTPSPTSPSPPSRPSRSSMMTPLITARGDIGETGPVRPAPWPSSMGFENELTQPSIYAHHRQGDTAPTPPPPLQQPSVQTLEPLVAPCVAMLFDTVISTTTDRSSANKAFLPARLDALRENEQQLRQSDHNGGPQGQQHGMPQCQHQQDCLTATLFATPKAQLEDNNQQQRDHWQPQEEEMGHLKATAAMTGKVEQKGKPTSSEEVGGADWMTSQLSEARWNRVKERSTELYHKAIKSFEISARAHRVSQESHFQYDKLVRRWKVMGDMGDAQELEDWEGDGKERSTKS